MIVKPSNSIHIKCCFGIVWQKLPRGNFCSLSISIFQRLQVISPSGPTLCRTVTTRFSDKPYINRIPRWYFKNDSSNLVHHLVPMDLYCAYKIHPSISMLCTSPEIIKVNKGNCDVNVRQPPPWRQYSCIYTYPVFD